MKAFALILFTLSFGMLTGCVGYVAGPTNGLPAGAQSVRVEFFKNETLEPRLVVAVNRALKRNCNRMAPTLCRPKATRIWWSPVN